MQSLQIKVGAQTDAGRVRRHNEDAFGFREPTDAAEAAVRGALYVVADGMGGHVAGEIASRLAVETILAAYRRDSSPLEQGLRSAIEAASLRIRLQAESNPEQTGMGTTCVCAVVRGSELHLAHVGDSRAYLLRDGQLSRLTRDHTWVQQQVAQQLLDVDEAARHPMRNVLTQALGGASVEIELTRHELRPDDALLLCTDGLTDALDDARIADILVARREPQDICAELVRQANEAGGPDNITTLVLAARTSTVPSAGDPQSAARRTGSDSQRHRHPAVVPVAVVFLVLLGLLAGLVMEVRPSLAPTVPTPQAETTVVPAQETPTATPLPTATPVATPTEVAPSSAPEG